jgi:predicted nucleic acid-binding protein
LSLFVDTSVWSLALRRDGRSSAAHVVALVQGIENGELLLTTGLILQELLQGFSGPKSREQILERFAALPLLVPDRQDHIDAAELRNACRRHGVQVGTIDALLAQLCIRHNLLMLTSDNDFQSIANHCALRLWQAPG